MDIREDERRRRAARPLLSYAPEFMAPKAAPTQVPDEKSLVHRQKLAQLDQLLLDPSANEPELLLFPQGERSGTIAAQMAAVQAELHKHLSDNVPPSHVDEYSETENDLETLEAIVPVADDSSLTEPDHAQDSVVTPRRKPLSLILIMTIIGGLAGGAYSYLHPLLYPPQTEQLVSAPQKTVTDSAELQTRLANLKVDADRAEKRVADWHSAQNASQTMGQDTAVTSDPQLEAAKAEAQRISQNADSLRGLSADGLAQNGVPEQYRGGLLGVLVENYTSARARLLELSRTLGPLHPQMIDQQISVDETRATVDTEIRQLRETTQAELQQALAREQQLAAQIANMKATTSEAADTTQLRNLERDAAAKRALFDEVQLEASRGKQPLTNTPLSAPEKTDSLLVWLAVGLGAAAGLLAGIIMALLRRLRPTAVVSAPQEEPMVELSDMPETLPGETRLGAAIREANMRWEAENNIAPLKAGRIADVKQAITDVRSAMADYHKRNS